MTRYVELQCASHFSFLRGISSAEELFAQALALGMDALAVTDRNTLAGIVRAHEAAKTTGIRLIVGCHLQLTDGSQLLVYPTDRPAYSRLCRLLSLGKNRAGKGKCSLSWDDLAAWSEGRLAFFDRLQGVIGALPASKFYSAVASQDGSLKKLLDLPLEARPHAILCGVVRTLLGRVKDKAIIAYRLAILGLFYSSAPSKRHLMTIPGAVTV